MRKSSDASTAAVAVAPKDYLPFQEALASLLLDEEQTSKLCTAILLDSSRASGVHSSSSSRPTCAATAEELAAFFPHCTVPTTYPAVVHNWISSQLQPFLTSKPQVVSHAFSSISSIGSSSGAVGAVQPLPASSIGRKGLAAVADGGATDTSSVNLPPRNNVSAPATNTNYDNTAAGTIISNTFAGLPIVSKNKQKKRMTPVIVSTETSSYTTSVTGGGAGGNIAGLPNSTGMDISVRNVQTNLRNLSYNPGIESICSQTATIESTGVSSDLNISNISIASNISNSNSNNALASMASAVASIAQSRNKITTEPYIVEKIQSSTLANGNFSSGVAPVVALRASRECAARLLGRVYGCLVMRQLVSLNHALTLVVKAAASSIGEDNYVRTVSSDNTFFSILVDDSSMTTFVLAVVKAIMPVVKSLGNPLLGSLLKLDMLKRPGVGNKSSVCNELQSCYEDNIMLMGASEEEEAGILLNTDTTFIRRFREEVDSRYEYKSSLECFVYNEREQLFDMFSNLFHQFQEVDRSDLDGSKVSDFLKYNLPLAKPRVLAMKDINMVWFVGIFRDMALFYGINNSIAEARPLLTLSSTSGGGGGSSGGGSRRRMLESRMGYPSNQPTPTPSQNTNRVGGSSSSSNRVNNSNSKPNSAAIEDVYSEQAAMFPGNQQFFFRFMLLIDSSRFSQHLEVAINSEINHLVDSTAGGVYSSRLSLGLDSPGSSRDRGGSKDDDSDVPTPTVSTDSYTLRVLKLKLLGKFLGVIKFSSFWSLSSGVNPAGPLLLLLREEARARLTLSQVHNGALAGVNAALNSALIARKTSLAVSWVAEFIKMSYWDIAWTFVATAEDGTMQSSIFGEILATLKSIQRVHGSCLNRGTREATNAARISSNQVYTLLEIQNLWLSLPVSTAVRSALICDTFNGAHPSSTYIQADLFGGSSRSRSNSCTSPSPVKGASSSPVDITSASRGMSASNNAFTDANSDAFSSAFIRHVAPFLGQLLKTMNSSSALRGVVGASRSSVRRQTPNVVVPSATSGFGSLNSFGISSSVVLGTASGVSSASVSLAGTPISTKKSAGQSSKVASSTIASKLSLSSPSASKVDRTLGGGGSGGQTTFYMPSPVTPGRRAVSPQIGPSRGSSLHRYADNDIHSKLEISFWQQHVNLYSINVFVIDNLRNASLAHLKDKVAEAIHELWGTAAALRADVEEEMSVNNSAAHYSSFVAKFQSALADFERRLHANTLRDGLAFLQEFNSNHLRATLPDLCTLYPCHNSVADLAVRFISKRAEQQQRALLTYLDSYSARKFAEVITISVGQFQKALDGKELLLKRASASGSHVTVTSEETLMAKLVRMHSQQFSGLSVQDGFKACLAELSVYYENIPASPYEPPLLITSNAFGAVDDLSRGLMYRKRIGACADLLKAMLDLACLHVANEPFYQRHLLDLAAANGNSATERQLSSTPGEAVSCVACVVSLVEAFVTALCDDICRGALLGAHHKQTVAKARVDIAKFFTLSTSALLFLDHYVAITPLSIAMPTPSACVLHALAKGVLTPSAFARIITAVSRRAVAAYFESCRGYLGFRRCVHICALRCVGSYLLTVPAVASEIRFMQEGGQGEWTTDHSVLHAVKGALGGDFHTAVVKLVHCK